jgi:hypothetical protein
MAKGFIHTLWKSEHWVNEVEEGAEFGGAMSGDVVTAIEQLAKALRAANATGRLTADSECWLTFSVSPAEFEALDGIVEDAEDAPLSKAIYRDDDGPPWRIVLDVTEELVPA